MTSRRECPEDYEEYSNACYYFGSYSSHDAAKQSCEAVGARLADVDSVNGKYIKEKVHFIGGNDHWIGSYIDRGRVKKRKGKNCPMLRGQSGRIGGQYAQVSCNSAYPFICQKYGENRFSGGNRDVVGYEGFIPGINGEYELPITPKTKEVTTAPVNEANPNNSLAAVVSCVVILIVSAFLIRFYCNKQSKKQLKQEKQSLQKQQQESFSKTSNVTNKCSTNTLNSIGTLSRAASIKKHFSIPETLESLEQPPISKRPSLSESTFYRSRSRRTPSFERHLHGRHKHSSRPSSPFETSYLPHDSRSRNSRRRSMSALGSMTDLATTRYSNSSGSDRSDESPFSDSAISTSTASSFQSYHRRRSHHRAIHYRRDESRTDDCYREHKNHHHHSHRRHRRRRRHSKHGIVEPQSCFERYAIGNPPDPAFDLMERKIDSERFRQQQTYLKRSLPRSDGDAARRNHSRMQDSLKPSYFPQLFTTWSREDLRISENLKKAKSSPQPLYPRSMAKAHIRVNRHIHDFVPSNQKTSDKRSETNDSDHIYESLDDMSSSHERHHNSKRL